MRQRILLCTKKSTCVWTGCRLYSYTVHVYKSYLASQVSRYLLVVTAGNIHAMFRWVLISVIRSIAYYNTILSPLFFSHRTNIRARESASQFTVCGFLTTRKPAWLWLKDDDSFQSIYSIRRYLYNYLSLLITYYCIVFKTFLLHRLLQFFQ